MKTHKKQHFVPRSYLRAWCDRPTPERPEPFLWLFARDGTDPRRKAPDNVFHETDLYTIASPDGTRDLRLEHGLAQLESEFVSIRDTKLENHQALLPEEHVLLCCFVAAMHARTPAMRDHMSREWGKAVAMGEQMMAWAKTATPEQRRAASSLSSPSARKEGLTFDQLKALAQQPLQTGMASWIKTEAPLLTRLDYAVLSSDGTPGFITSDNPCVWFDAQAYKRPLFYQAPGLAYDSIEITLPVSPRQILVLNRAGINGYLKVPEPVVDEFNRRTRHYCAEYFVTNSNQTRPVWFQAGERPRDEADTQ